MKCFVLWVYRSRLRVDRIWQMGLLVVLLAGTVALQAAPNGESDYKKGHKAASKLDFEKAIPYLTKAAEVGHVEALAELGNCYAMGNGVKADGPRAIAYLEPAVAASNVLAMTTLARLYEYGVNGTPKDPARSLHYLVMAANAGDVTSCVNAAEALHPARGFLSELVKPRPDDVAAFAFAKRAALAGNYEGMEVLGTYHEYGVGTETNTAAALAWYREAVKKGSTRAKLGVASLTGERPQFERTDYRYHEQHRKEMEAHPERQLTKADLPGGHVTAAESAAYEAWWTKTYGNQYTTPTTPAGEKFYFKVPEKTTAQRDQEMYDKMHREQKQREKSDKEKWRK